MTSHPVATVVTHTTVIMMYHCMTNLPFLITTTTTAVTTNTYHTTKKPLQHLIFSTIRTLAKKWKSCSATSIALKKNKKTCVIKWTFRLSQAWKDMGLMAVITH
eukprot:PhF_6_TR41553/c0_g1_i1/m.62943